MKHARVAVLVATVATAAVATVQLSSTVLDGAADPQPPRVRPDILLVTIDALRADHVTSYGYDRLTSPSIDAFAHGAMRFTNAIAQAPYTKASVASLLTGFYPTTHKTVTTSVPFPETMTGHPTTKPLTTDVLPRSATTLAEALHESGYRTVGFTANPFLIEAFGFAQGFDRFEFYPGADFAGSDRLVADALDAACRADATRPLFVWVHLMEPHSPYAPPPLTAGMFKISAPAEPIDARVAIPGWLLADSPRDRRPYLAAYDDDIAAADVAVGTLIREFEPARLLRDAVIVVTADHGEEFLDHGHWEHGSTLHDELIRVPLVIKAPGFEAGVTDAQVQLIDLYPTLLAFANATTPSTPGHDLSGVLHHRGDGWPAMSELVGAQTSLRDEGYKLIAFDDGRMQLFDLAHDPAEQADVAATDRPRVDRLKTRLDRTLTAARETSRTVRRESAPIDPAVAERLRALGYAR